MGNISINLVYAPSENVWTDPKAGEAKWEAERDTIRTSIGRIEQGDLNYGSVSLSDFLAKIEAITANVPKTEVTVTLEDDGSYGDTCFYLQFEHVRKETDEEMTVRLQAQAARRQVYEIEQVMKERATLAALKAKYGE